MSPWRPPPALATPSISDSVLVAVAAPFDPGSTLRAAPGAPRLVFRRIAAGTARDALDAGADVVVTRDPEAIAYAATRADLASVPLPWDRAYVLLQRRPAGDAAAADAGSAALAARTALASDAVRVEARAAEGAPHWAARIAACAGPRAVDVLLPAAAPAPRIAYASGDAVSAALAARLVALAARRDGALRALAPGLEGIELRAAGLAPDALARALRDGRDAAYVMALPPASDSASCTAAGALPDRAPWLPLDSSALAGLVAPLIDTRPRAIVRRDLRGVLVDSSGVVRAVAGGPGAP